MPKENTNQGGGVNLLLVAILGFFAWNYFQKPTDPAPQPDPTPAVVSPSKAAAKVLPSQRDVLRAAWRDVAAKVRAKEIKTEEEVSDYLKKNVAPNLSKAWDPFYASMNNTLPPVFEGKEETVAKILEDIGKSF